MTRFANYEYREKIGQGAFGMIYKGRNIKTNEQVVVKMEPFVASEIGFSTLKHESNILNILYSKHCRNIPPTYWYGTISDPPRRVLVMPFYEESLAYETSFVIPSGSSANSLSKDTPTPIPDRMFNIMRSSISILAHIHDKYVIHRDIKPANFMIHHDELILIDFGLATFYVDSEEHHILPVTESTKKEHIIGTPKYASWNIHCGEEYSRRDDLMSIVYIGLFLLYGSNLWTMTGQKDQDHSPTLSHRDRPGIAQDPALLVHPRNQWFKMQKTRENVLNMSSHCKSLQLFAAYIYGLSFQERPSYKKYIELFDKPI